MSSARAASGSVLFTTVFPAPGILLDMWKMPRAYLLTVDQWVTQLSLFGVGQRIFQREGNAWVRA